MEPLCIIAARRLWHWFHINPEFGVVAFSSLLYQIPTYISGFVGGYTISVWLPEPFLGKWCCCVAYRNNMMCGFLKSSVWLRNLNSCNCRLYIAKKYPPFFSKRCRMSSIWTSEKDEILINFVRMHEEIYNIKCKGYRNTQYKQKLWCDIGVILNKTGRWSTI